MKIMKRILSVTIIATLAAQLFSGVSIFAEGEYFFDDIDQLMEEEGLNGSVSEHAPLNPVFVDIEQEEIYTDRDFEAREEEADEAKDADTADADLSGADRSVDAEAVWDALFSMEFGDAYNKPYQHSSSKTALTGDSNRLIIEETDLHLPGKNGLDLDLKRKYDNQDDNNMYFSTGAIANATTNLKLYSYKNLSTNENINIAFLTEDQMYQFMPDEFCVSQLRTQDRKSKRLADGSYIYFYHFSDVYRFKANSGITLQRNAGVAPVSIQIQEAGYDVLDCTMIAGNNDLYGGWQMIMPGVTLYVQDHGYHNSAHTGLSREFIGAFRDIHGNVSRFKATDAVDFSDLSSGNFNSVYEHGKIIQHAAFYDGTSTFENTGIKYNFTSTDPDGLTYYFYSNAFEEAIADHTYGYHFYMSIVAVEDKYGNYILYSYDDAEKEGPVTGIRDTYGREISISRSNNNCTVSYEDEAGDTKTISYSSSTQPASTLNNDSPLSHRDINVFSVTNQLGETTSYYSRPAELISYYTGLAYTKIETVLSGYVGVYVSHQNNIELIEYPTGAKTEYDYVNLGYSDTGSRMLRQEYAVCGSRDIINNTVENDTEYSFANNNNGITKTAVNNVSDAKTVSVYNTKRLLTSEKTTPSSASHPYYSVSYTYDSNGYLKNTTTNNNGSSRTIYRTNYDDGLVKTEYDGTWKNEYQYYGNGTIKTAITYKRPGSNYIEQFRYTTTPNSVGDKPEYAKTLEGTGTHLQVMSQVKYEYNNDGEISTIKQWTNDTNADGALDEEDDIIISHSTYQTAADNDLIYSKYINNVYNVDDDNDGTVSSTYKINMFGNPVSKTDSYGTVSYIEYDDLNRPVNYTYANGAEATIEYDLSNLYTLITTPDGIKKKNIYDKLGRLIRVQRIYGNTANTLEEYTYDSAGRVSTKINRTDANVGTKEQYTYNALGKPVEKKVYSLPNTLLYTEAYSYSTNDITITTTAADNTSAAQRKEFYDTHENLTQKQSISGNTTLNEYYTYDYLDRMITSKDANNNITSYEYDCKNNVIKVTDAAGNETSTEYDLANRVYSVTDANGNVSYAEYDKLGRTIRETKPFDNSSEAETKTYYDKNSNIVKTAVKKSNNVYQEEEYRYDVMGNLLGVIANDGNTDIVTQYEYDSANRMTKRITGLSIYSANPTGGAVTEYEYGIEGFLEHETNPLGNELWNFEYDYLGNVKEGCEDYAYRTYTYGPYGLTSERRYFYTGSTKKEYTYNSLGQLTQTKNTNSPQGEANTVTTESYTYDAFGRPAAHTTNDGSVQSYTYDNNSNVTGYTLNKNGTTKNQISYAYNSLNQLTSLTKDGIITSYEYDSVGHLTSRENNAGIRSEYTYNAAGLITGLDNKVNDTSVNHRIYGYYLNGYKYVESELGTFGSFNLFYRYDGAGRLKRETEYGMADYDNVFTYDLRGNCISKSDNDNDEVTTYTYDAADRLLTANTTEDGITTEEHSYTYDYRGCLTEEDIDNYTDNTSVTKTYGFDFFRRLTSYSDGTTTAKYEYNADNLRTAKTVNNTRTDYVWDGANVMYEYGGTTGSYAYDMTGILQNGTDTYLKDEHGNITCKYSSAGASLGTAEYDAFGNKTTGSINDPFGYCGEYRDSESGLIYLRNRYYDPSIGRFITEDPAKDGMNWYSYCAGNPVNAWDPWGLKPVMMRYIVEKNGGTVLYNDETGVAQLNYKENTMYVRYDDDNDSLDILIDNQRVHVNGHIENGRFLIDSSVLVQYLGIEEENSTHMNEDRYYSEEDAVIAFGLSYIQISKDDKCEYGAFINYSDERFYYEDIFVGDSTSISPSIYNAYIRENSKALTHAHGEEIIERENFSYADANVAKDLNVNMYLTTPQWCVKKLDSNYEPPKTATWNFIPPKCQIIADNISI